MSVQTPWTLAVILCITLGISPVKAATISEPPGDDEINQAIAETLPGYWGLHSSILTGPVDYGNAIEPDWRWRFETVITPKEPLFFEGGKRDNVVLLQPTLAPDSQETLYGIVRATFHAGNWNIEIGHENKPFDSRGLPASFFPGRTIVIGSPEEKAELEEAQKHSLETLQATHEKELSVLKNEQERALAKAEETHRAALAAAQADRDAKLAALNTEQETALAATAETHRTALAAFRDALAVAQADRDAKLAALNTEQETALAATAETHRTALAAFRDALAVAQADRDAKLAALNTEQETALAATAETHRTALAAFRDALAVAQADRDAKLAALNTEREEALAEIAETHRTTLAALKIEREKATAEITKAHRATLAALESELKAEAEKYRIEIAQAEALTELAATATHKLAVLHENEAEMLAATEQLFDARQAALNDLGVKLDTFAGVESYQSLLRSVAETGSDWLFEAVMRHGLNSDDQAIRQAAWIHLIRTDLEGAASLRTTLSDHVADLSENPRLGAFLWDHLSGPSETPRLLSFLANHVQALVGNPEAIQALAGNPEAIQALVGNPEAIQALVGNPEAIQALVGNPEAIQALVGNPEAIQALVGNPEAIQALAGNPEAIQALVGNPEAIQALVGNPEAIQALVGNPEAIQALVGNPEAIQALVGNPEAIQALVGNPEAIQALAGNPEAIQALVGNPEAIQALVGNPEAIQALVGNPEAIQALVGNPEAIAAIKNNFPPISQWASEVVEFSSQYGNSDYAATQLLGEPDVPTCTDNNSKAWATKSANAGNEYVRVRFANPVWFPEIGVHENHAVGAIRKIILYDNEGSGTEYDVEDPLKKCPGISQFHFDEYKKPVNEFTVVLDTRAVSGWNEIDAISLKGRVLEVK